MNAQFPDDFADNIAYTAGSTANFIGNAIGKTIAYSLTIVGSALSYVSYGTAQKIIEVAPPIVNGLGEVLFDSFYQGTGQGGVAGLNKVLTTINTTLGLCGVALTCNYALNIYNDFGIYKAKTAKILACEKELTCEPTLVEVKLPPAPAGQTAVPPHFGISNKAKKTDPNIIRFHIPLTDQDLNFHKTKLKSNIQNFFAAAGTASLVAFDCMGTMSINESPTASGPGDAFNRTIAFIPTSILGVLGWPLKHINANVLNAGIIAPGMILGSLYTVSKVDAVWRENGKWNYNTMGKDLLKLSLAAYLASTACFMWYDMTQR